MCTCVACVHVYALSDDFKVILDTIDIEYSDNLI